MSQWISVKTRLPENHECVLAYNGKISQAHYNENPGQGIAALWESHYKEGPDHWGLYNVTHWMPLPEPPEEKE